MKKTNSASLRNGTNSTTSFKDGNKEKRCYKSPCRLSGNGAEKGQKKKLPGTPCGGRAWKNASTLQERAGAKACAGSANIPLGRAELALEYQ